MAPNALYSLILFAAVSNVYAAAVFVGIWRGRMPLFESAFSFKRFYFLMGWAPLAFLALALAFDLRYLVLFFVAGVAGIAGELVVSIVWRRFFEQPIWTYSYRAVLGGYTSTLNFLPWAVGALLFQQTSLLLRAGQAPDPALEPMLVSAASLAVGFTLAWPARRFTTARDREFSKPAFAVFCLPIAAVALGLGIFSGVRFPIAMSLFAVVGFSTEYIYGRSMSVFFERSLWTYNHWPIDGGHTSFVTLPLWALGGLYFHFIAACLGL